MKHFTKKDMQMANKLVKDFNTTGYYKNKNQHCLSSYYTHLLEQLKQTVATPNASDEVEKLDFSYITGETIKWHAHSEVWRFL